MRSRLEARRSKQGVGISHDNECVGGVLGLLGIYIRQGARCSRLDRMTTVLVSLPVICRSVYFIPSMAFGRLSTTWVRIPK